MQPPELHRSFFAAKVFGYGDAGRLTIDFIGPAGGWCYAISMLLSSEFSKMVIIIIYVLMTASLHKPLLRLLLSYASC